MGILADWQIKQELGSRIVPFSPCMNRKGIISYGLSSYGYDARVGFKFRVFTNAFCREVDPKDFDPLSFVEIDVSKEKPNKQFIRIPPNSFALAETLEEFSIPRDMLCVVVGKSTYARCGLIVNVTPGEPEWKGRWTVEISNTTPQPARVYAGEGIMQCLFFRSDGDRGSIKAVLNRFNLENGQTCGISYADKKGKYQDQDGMTNPKVL